MQENVLIYYLEHLLHLALTCYLFTSTLVDSLSSSLKYAAYVITTIAVVAIVCSFDLFASSLFNLKVLIS